MNKNPLESYSPSDLLCQLIVPQYEDFLKNNASVRHAVLTVILSYHMYEWVHREKFTKEHFENCYADEADVDKMVELFVQARAITNDLKHCNFGSDITLGGGFSALDWSIGGDWARPINVVTPKGKISMDKLLRELVGFWKRRVSIPNVVSH